jgi:hypothetical protein
MRRTWTNPAHHQTPAWRIFVFGASLGFGSLGVAEVLLRLAA